MVSFGRMDVERVRRDPGRTLEREEDEESKVVGLLRRVVDLTEEAEVGVGS